MLRNSCNGLSLMFEHGSVIKKRIVAFPRISLIKGSFHQGENIAVCSLLRLLKKIMEKDGSYVRFKEHCRLVECYGGNCCSRVRADT